MLFRSGTTSGAFYCSVCNVIYPTKDKAEWCHGERLCACGKKIEQRFFEIRCEECKRKMWHEKEAAKEAERFEKANKIKASEYTGDHVMCNDQYYDCVEDAIDQYFEGQEPEYMWACKDDGIPSVDLEDVICNIIDNMWEDADTSDLNGVEELEAALKAFNEANESIQVCTPDYSTAILVEKKA